MRTQALLRTFYNRLKQNDKYRNQINGDDDLFNSKKGGFKDNKNPPGTFTVAEHAASVSEIINNENNKNNILQRGNTEGLRLSNQAPVYYEDAWLHNEHVGTGNKEGTAEYKEKIKKCLKDDNVAGAFIENCKGYGNIPQFQEFYKIDDKDGDFNNIKAAVSHESFINMLENNPQFEIRADNGGIEKRKLKDDSAKLSVLKARYEAYNGNKPIKINSVLMRRMNADIERISPKTKPA